MKQLILAVVVIVGIIAGATFFANNKTEPEAKPSGNFYGQEEGIITFTEYADFQCPGCASFEKINSAVRKKFGNQVRFEFKHFPIVAIHPNTIAAHRAVEAAARQGKFWEMHDMVFARQQEWTTVSRPSEVLRGFAEQLGLDLKKYDTDVKSPEILATINADTKKGKELGIVGTPSFFIDGVEIKNPTETVNTLDSMSEQIQKAIDAKKASQNQTNLDSNQPSN